MERKRFGYHAGMHDNSDIGGAPRAPTRRIYSVAELNGAVCALLEGAFPLIWVEGEISNLSRPSSGHLYFTLKDARAQVRCAIFRQRAMLLGCKPQNGMHVLARARISLYEPRGDFQLIVEHMEEAGDGALLHAFELLKQKLAAEGLFDEARKKPLPALPGRIGVITSPSGAAVRDVLTTLRRRFPAIAARIYPVPVQGVGAAEKIAAALRLAGERGDCDVLILARGGGSLEDLWSFNEEIVARAIAACPLPIVTGIGHEVDFTIADLAADRRAPTPTGAAELVSPNGEEYLARFAQLETRLQQTWQHFHHKLKNHLQWLSRCLAQLHPGQRLRRHCQRADELELRLRQAWRAQQRRRIMHLEIVDAQLHRHLPVHRLEQLAVRTENLCQRLHAVQTRALERAHHRLSQAAGMLETVSPLATLARGYAIIRKPDGAVVRRAGDIASGERITAKLAEGTLNCKVEHTEST